MSIDETKIEERALDGSDDGEVSSGVSDGEDDDFGSFDDASYEETPAETQVTVEKPYVFDASQLVDLTRSRLAPLLESGQPVSDSQDKLDPAALLNERSTEILDRLSSKPTHRKIINETAWKKSTIRREMLLTLGLPLNLDEITETGKIGDMSGRFSVTEDDLALPAFESLGLSESEYADTLSTTLAYLDSLNIQRPDYYRSVTSTDKLEAALESLTSDLANLKKIYVCWSHYRASLQKDNTTFQDYVENMVGNELKFRNEKILQAKHRKK